MEQTQFSPDAGGEPGALGDLGQDGYGDAPPVDPLMGQDAPKKKHTGVVVLIVVVGLAIGSLFSMHTLTKVTAASGRNSETEQTIEKFLKGMSGGGPAANPGDSGSDDLVQGHQEVVDVLKDDYTRHQVKELARNPFDLMSSGPVTGDLSGADGDYARAKRRDDIEKAAEKFQLKSVIMGSRPLANINGRIVRLNQVIPVEGSRSVGTIKFRVASISPDSVTVVAEDPQLELRVEKVLQLKR
ncbi:MAG: hypothetical protein ACYTE6_07655 [Planctomycetota bacterium]|jgi:hypothetical protein